MSATHIRKVCRVKRGKKACRAYRPSLVLGLLFDLWAVVNTAARMGAWPVRMVAHWIHRELRKHPAFRFRHSHVVLCMAIGFCLVLTSFALEGLFKHVLWNCTLETMRATGVCPIWDAVSGISKVYAELAE
jgi:hypothetical protein